VYRSNTYRLSVFSAGVQIADNQNITLGDDDNATIQYDETWFDRLIITCSDGIIIDAEVWIDGNFISTNDGSDDLGSAGFAWDVGYVQTLRNPNDTWSPTLSDGTHTIAFK